MRIIAALGLVFGGLWGITYYLNPHAFGSNARTSVAFAVLAAVVTAGIGMLVTKPGDR
jgi:hypothetical protein